MGERGALRALVAARERAGSGSTRREFAGPNQEVGMKNKYWRMLLAIGVIATFLVGCQSSNQTEETQPTSAEQSAAGGKASKSRSAESKTAGPVMVTVPAGTALEVRLVDAIGSGTAETGTGFEATLASPIVVGGKEVAAVGSSVKGEVTNAVSSGRLSKPAELSLTLTSLTPKGGKEVAITTSTWSMKGESHKKRNTEMIGGGAAAGALIGAITGGKKGAAIGAGIGAGGGTGVAAATGKKEITLPSETKLSFKLSEAVSLPAPM